MFSQTEDERETARVHRWWKDEVTVSDTTRKILEEYSKIPPDQVISHIDAVRKKAWAVHPYGCVGQGTFLDPQTAHHALYPEIVQRLRTGHEDYLDLGCGFGQDIRRLVAIEAIDPANCYGSDLLPELIELGYELFQDRERLPKGKTFFQGDIFDDSSPLSQLNGKIDIMSTNCFFHLFDQEQQKQVAIRVAKLLKPKKDSLVVGRQLGNETPGIQEKWSQKGTLYRQNIKSLQAMWDEVGVEVGAKFKVDGFERPVEDLRHKAGEEGLTWMEFSIRRVS